jgi:hypothetical protein
MAFCVQKLLYTLESSVSGLTRLLLRSVTCTPRLNDDFFRLDQVAVFPWWTLAKGNILSFSGFIYLEVSLSFDALTLLHPRDS